MAKGFKFLLLFVLFLFVPANSVLAETKEQGRDKEPSTQMERFLAKKGQLIIKDFYHVANLSGDYGAKMDIHALIIYEPGKETQRVKGMKIEITEGGRLERSNAAFLDFDEVESLAGALKYIIDLSEQWRSQDKQYTEVFFTTKGHFEIGFYQKSSDSVPQKPFAAAGYINKVNFFFPAMVSLVSIKNAVDAGLKILLEE